MGVGDVVLIERIATRQRWTANRAVAAVLVAFSGGRTRMVEYRADTPDPGPLVHRYCEKLPTAFDLSDAAATELTASITAVLHNTEVSASLDRTGLLILLAHTFCFTETEPGAPSTGMCAPLMQRRGRRAGR
ncbi:hypothetical protein FDG2_2738 [Candidatus Protofrankia californiensis]|uniref:Uncharacterized protein n=1 Tax=Candidatus Protofrankia californiensis TaxID=1839754 RepID=A0A1C3NY59_9ACTN|nr:hypothetical protein FDG2_2738 [Candidatus Protofrankia californiensis]